MLISGFLRIVNPAGFASAADASSASPRNAPPMPRERAPGLPKLNWSPQSDSMSVFCAASGSATSEQTIAAKTNLRIEILRFGTDRKDSRGKVVSGQEAVFSPPGRTPDHWPLTPDHWPLTTGH